MKGLATEKIVETGKPTVVCGYCGKTIHGSDETLVFQSMNREPICNDGLEALYTQYTPKVSKLTAQKENRS